MKKKIFIFILVLFLLLNSFSIYAFYNNFIWNTFYKKENFSEAIKYFSNSHNIYWEYNKANSLYKEKKYKDAVKIYKSILTKQKNEINFRLNHNVWNWFYRIWEEEKDSIKKIKFWKEAIKYYLKALEIKFDEETNKNLEFVQNKIKQENKKQEDKKQEDKKQEDKKQEDKKQENKKQEDKKGWKKGENKEDWEKNKDWKEGKTWKENKEWDNKAWKEWETKKAWKENKNWDNKTWKEGKSWEDKLSKQQEDILQAYEQKLKKDQEQNAWNFNKVYQEQTNPFDNFDSFFENDPFFNNNLLNRWSEERDW